MFIDDLLPAYLSYRKKIKKGNFLSSRHRQAISRMNQDIYIRDLVVRTPPARYGEAVNDTNPYLQPAVERLGVHISFLFNLANEEHRANYCEQDVKGNFHIKKEKENYITRLSLPEFSLYTPDQPLTEEEFQNLYLKIGNMADKLEPNVHVLLSSFAIRNKHGDLLNMCLYVEGGCPSIIHAFCKSTPSDIDVTYNKREPLFSQQRDNPDFHAHHITTKEGYTVTTGSVFEVTTKGGACFTQAIDICLDHELEHSKSFLEERINTEMMPNEILPKQIEYCVTANSIDLQYEYILASYVLHVDPLISMHHSYHAKLGKGVLAETVRYQLIPEDFNHMEIRKHKLGYLIVEPPFGSDCIVEVLAERPAARYISTVEECIDLHNKKVLNRQMDATNLFFSQEENLFKVIDETHALAHKMRKLEQELLKQCEPSFLQKQLKTVEYQQKQKAAQIIRNSFALIQESIAKNESGSLFLLRPWKNELLHKLNALSPCKFQSCKDALCNKIRSALEHDFAQELKTALVNK
ncbi:MULTISPECIES: hypothetical protein [Legionella]|uniref:hypothetical protein n=1 Tax=Legionella TaxID=445 RepID=UPI000F8F1D11|nr:MULTISPECIES: hypothetical protein [Legionella]MCP0914425.1 hypothetical protein [Legionella sp. 27cVA30]RUR10521.1 hypothetical protein ELY14_05300 [Legionella septentrionalis]RUR16141.1 hypothetical protein ELY10_04375 [Legionella septentrionalis]